MCVYVNVWVWEWASEIKFGSSGAKAYPIDQPANPYGLFGCGFWFLFFVDRVLQIGRAACRERVCQYV